MATPLSFYLLLALLQVWQSATLSTHVTPGSQGVSMPSFMSIGPRMLVLEGNMHTDSRTDTVLLLLCTVKVTEWPGA